MKINNSALQGLAIATFVHNQIISLFEGDYFYKPNNTSP